MKYLFGKYSGSIRSTKAYDFDAYNEKKVN